MLTRNTSRGIYKTPPAPVWGRYQFAFEQRLLGSIKRPWVLLADDRSIPMIEAAPNKRQIAIVVVEKAFVGESSVDWIRLIEPIFMTAG